MTHKTSYQRIFSEIYLHFQKENSLKRLFNLKKIDNSYEVFLVLGSVSHTIKYAVKAIIVLNHNPIIAPNFGSNNVENML